MTDFLSENAGHLNTNMAVTPEVIANFNWLYDQLTHMYANQPAMKRDAMKAAFNPPFVAFKAEPAPTTISSNDLVPAVQVLRESVKLTPWGDDFELGKMYCERALAFTIDHCEGCGLAIKGDPKALQMVHDTFFGVVEVPNLDLLAQPLIDGTDLDEIKDTGEYAVGEVMSNAPDQTAPAAIKMPDQADLDKLFGVTKPSAKQAAVNKLRQQFQMHVIAGQIKKTA